MPEPARSPRQGERGVASPGRKASARKAITLRLQQRDIERLKVIAGERGLPYQTLVSSVLHQFASGTLVERGG